MSVSIDYDERPTGWVERESKLRNPYLEVFLKYMMPPGSDGRSFGLFDWDARTEWRYEDGFNGWRWDRHMMDSTNAFQARRLLVERFAWAVPNDAAINAIAALNKPVVEIAAGLGYWGWLLDQVNVPNVLYDKWAGCANNYKVNDEWKHVRRGDHNALKHRWSGAALMLSWIPYSSPLGEECLRLFCGDTFILIGEHYGCTGTERLPEMLPEEVGETESGWTLTQEVMLPQWTGMHDYLTIYKR